MSLGRLDPRKERRWRGTHNDQQGPSRGLLVALVLACLTVMSLDSLDSSPVDPARRAVGEVFGPAEVASAAAIRPFTAVPDWFRSKDSMQQDLLDLQAENSDLRSKVAARVVGLGPSQSFSRTVTIDAGSDAGIHPDLTVVNNDGLVGRVLRVTRTTATVLLAVDADSVVGGRVGRSMEVGF